MTRILTLFMVTLLVACGGSGSDKSSTRVGLFIDSQVEGIQYKTASQSGKTNAKGQFKFTEGESVTFSIGDILLPEVKAAEVIHVSGLYDGGIESQQVINLARLLLTLDVDGDPTNGISISSKALSESKTVNIDFSSPTFETDVINFVANAGGSETLVSEEDVKEHIAKTLEEVERYTSFEEDKARYKCGGECLQNARYSDDVINYSPHHQAMNVSPNTVITIQASDAVSLGSGTVYVEMFPLNGKGTGCRIDWSGFECITYPEPSKSLLDTIIVNPGETLRMLALVGGESFYKEDDINKNPVVSGTGVVSNNKATLTLEKPLLPSTTYLVHVYKDGEENFKTWWSFRTHGSVTTE